MLQTKRGKAIWIIVSVVCVVLVLIFGYFYFNYSRDNSEKNSGGQELVNPVKGLSDEEAIVQFNESFVFYLLASIKAYNLHAPPLSSDNPKIGMIVGEDRYNAEVIDGGIRIGRGAIDGGDIIIKTTKEEGVKMLRDRNYISKSFKDGKSEVELVAGKIKLAAKGYIKIYEELS